MNERIVYQNDEGGISIVTPVADCGLTLEQIIAKDVPAGAPYVVVDVADIPSDRTFRAAWICAGKKFDVDMPKARDIQRDRLRALRAPKMKVLDVDFMRALEVNDTAKQAQVAAAKQALRDVTADPAIEAAKTPAELKAVVPAILLDGAVPAVAPAAPAVAPVAAAAKAAPKAK